MSTEGLSPQQFWKYLELTDRIIALRVEDTIRRTYGDLIRRLVDEAVADILATVPPTPEPFNPEAYTEHIDGDHLTDEDIAWTLDNPGVPGDLRN